MAGRLAVVAEYRDAGRRWGAPVRWCARPPAATRAQDVEGGEDATVSFTAPAAGSYKFLCKYHPSAMTGTVTVT